MNKYIASSLVAGALFMAGGVSAELIITAPEPEVKAESNTQVKVQSQDAKTSLETKVEVNTERVLPTVNKKSTAKVTVRGWDTEKKEQIEARINATLENNVKIRSAEVSENAVVVVYAAPAKLFGFIPMTMNMQVEADANARVKVKFPWYKFMVKTSFSNSAEVMNGVFQNNQTDLEFLKARAAEDRQVEIFIQISNSLKAMEQ